ncbi:unnamed protein product, partial [marine sediment metagenome]
RSNLHNAKLITLECTFTITTQIECVEEANQIDLSLLPATLSEDDIENIKP